MPNSKVQRKQDSKTKINRPETCPPCVAIDLILECGEAETVFVCGDFNRWQPASLPMIHNPGARVWQKRLTLAPGRYEYKFVVDGKWVHDPIARENVPNIFGTLNSVVEVRP